MKDSLAPSNGLASIVVPCFDQIAYTRQCIRALSSRTRRPFELIVVDNGSTDETADYLRGVVDVAPFPTQVVSNPSNRGFPAAVNQGIVAARGDRLVLLNNDAVVTDGWLDQLTALAESDEAIGMVGPMSNYATPPQLVADVAYDDLEGMHAFARSWRERHLGRWLETPKLSGFCLLIKRRVLDRIGGLDERFGLGFFDDDDLCLRAREAGFRLCVAYDLFVHHFGGRTFAGSGVDAEALLRENRGRFEAKWGLAGVGREVVLKPWAGGIPQGPRGFKS